MFVYRYAFGTYHLVYVLKRRSTRIILYKDVALSGREKKKTGETITQMQGKSLVKAAEKIGLDEEKSSEKPT